MHKYSMHAMALAMISNKYIRENLPVLQILQSCNSDLAKEILRHASPSVLKAIFNLLELAFGHDSKFSLKSASQQRLRKRFGRSLNSILNKQKLSVRGRASNKQFLRAKVHLG